MRYHIDNNGDPRICAAEPGNCPFKNSDGSPATHYSSMQEAAEAYEKEKAMLLLPTSYNKPGNTSKRNSYTMLDNLLNNNKFLSLNNNNIKKYRNIVNGYEYNNSIDVDNAIKTVHSFGDQLINIVNDNIGVIRANTMLEEYYNNESNYSKEDKFRLSLLKQSAMRNVLSNYITFSEGNDLDYSLNVNVMNSSNSNTIRDSIINATRSFPKKWMDYSNNDILPLIINSLDHNDPDNNGRAGSYNKRNGILNFNDILLNNELNLTGNFAHELSHRVIESIPAIKAMNKRELELRTTQIGYKRDNPIIDYDYCFYKNKLSDIYAGRVYKNIEFEGYEYFTVGYQSLLWNRENYYKSSNKNDVLLDSYVLGAILMFGEE